MTGNRVLRGALLLAFISGVNVILGFTREGITAYYFGASAEIDTFLVAYTLPRIIVVHAVQITVSVILPLYVGFLETGRADLASALLRRWFVFLLKTATVLCLAMAIGAELIVRVSAPGLDVVSRDQAADWLRWLCIYVWVVTMSGCFKVVLDNGGRFFWPAISNGIGSIGVIVACVAGAASIGVGVMIPGLIAAGVLAFLIQWQRSNLLEPRIVGLRDLPAHVRLPIAGGIIMVVTSLAQQAGLIVDRGFASSLPEGSIAALNYASALIFVPQSIIAAAVATALFPMLASMVAQGRDREAFMITMRWSLVIVVVGLIPAAGLSLYRHEIVRILFARGEFGEAAADMTASVMRVLPLMVSVTGALSLVSRLLLARQQLRVLLLGATLMLGLKIGGNLLLVGPYGLGGLAAATVGAVTISTLALFVLAGLHSPGGRRRPADS